MGKSKFLDNTGAGLYGYAPQPQEHTAFRGYRAIWHNVSYIGGSKLNEYIDYVWNRQSWRGTARQIKDLEHWWLKRGGVFDKWRKSENRDDQPWTYHDEKLGNTAYVCLTYGYIYISLYHDEPKKETVQ